MGVDDLGNIYYSSFDKKRRWVIYEKENYASELSIEWHGWLHHTVGIAPSIEKPERKAWEKTHLENRTGSDFAYHPLGKNRKK